MASRVSPNVYAVIGAGYGDEGKGLVTDLLSTSSTRVVRFNGGAQAGHTVCTREGKRHVFHHIGAGTFRGASTHLSRFFAVNPILFWKEMAELPAWPDPVDTAITVDPNAAVTTPLDMMINQEIEDRRGGDRHGSCGVGFGETMERSVNGPVLTVEELMQTAELGHQILHVRLAQIVDWAKQRCDTLQLDFNDLPYDDEIEDAFVTDCKHFARLVGMMPDSEIGKDVDRVVFEGAQGLGLDMELGVMPHCTRSFTGLPNVVDLCQEAGFKDVSAVYVTRAYATRHGAGPLSMEDAFEVDWPEDRTNVPNYWQGSIRHAILDRAALARRIKADRFRTATPHVAVHPSLFMTCMDHAVRNLSPLVEDYGFSAVMDWPQLTAARCGISLLGESWGPTRDDVKDDKDYF